MLFFIIFFIFLHAHKQLSQRLHTRIKILVITLALAFVQILTALRAQSLAILRAKQSCGKRENGLVFDRLTYLDIVLGNQKILIVLILRLQLCGNGSAELDLQILGNRLKATGANTLHRELAGCGQRNISTRILDLSANVNVTGKSITGAVSGYGKIIFETLSCDLTVKKSLYVYLHDITFKYIGRKYKNRVNKKSQPTNADRCIGAPAIVTEEINNLLGTGAVRINGLIWTARSLSDDTIPINSTVTIKAIDGVKLIVE